MTVLPGPVEVREAAAPEADDVERMVEALLFASAEPLRRCDIEECLPEGSDAKAALGRLRQRYRGRGVELRKAGRCWAFRTAEDLEWMFDRKRDRERKLSRAALETLAIVAYHQPVTRAQIEDIRGVAVSRGTLDTLMELGWVGLGKRRQTPGRPATFVVTDGFLDHFGLESVGALPGLSELRELGLPFRSADDAGAAGAVAEGGDDEKAEASA